MVPANAPLPTTSSLPFQPLAGSHTSILMFDCGDDFSVAATRQNAGGEANGLAAFGAPARPAGGVNAPAATSTDSVTCGPSDVRLSHVAADASDGTTSRDTS